MGGKNQRVEPLGAIGEPLREMASALVDGETGEFETRRLLEQSTPELTALLARHYTVRSALRSEADLLAPPALSRSIMAALEQEPLPRGAVVAQRWQGWAGRAAIAASVCLVAVLGTRTLMQPEDVAATPQLAIAPSTLGQLGLAATRPAQDTFQGGTTPVGLRPGVIDDANGVARERLHMFMLEHAANTALNTPEGMMPYARVVSYEEP